VERQRVMMLVVGFVVSSPPVSLTRGMVMQLARPGRLAAPAPTDVLGRLRLLVRPEAVLRWHRDLLARRYARTSVKLICEKTTS
jgi:hypothetical protein